MKLKKVILIGIIALVGASILAVGIYASATGGLTSTFGTSGSTVSFTASGVYFNVTAKREGGLQAAVNDYDEKTYTEDGTSGSKSVISNMPSWTLNEALLDADNVTLTFTFTFTNEGSVTGYVHFTPPTQPDSGTTFTAAKRIGTGTLSGTGTSVALADTKNLAVASGQTLEVVFTFTVTNTSATIDAISFDFEVVISQSTVS